MIQTGHKISLSLSFLYTCIFNFILTVFSIIVYLSDGIKQYIVYKLKTLWFHFFCLWIRHSRFMSSHSVFWSNHSLQPPAQSTEVWSERVEANAPASRNPLSSQISSSSQCLLVILAQKDDGLGVCHEVSTVMILLSYMWFQTSSSAITFSTSLCSYNHSCQIVETWRHCI